MGDLAQRIAALSPEKRALLEQQLKKKKAAHTIFPLAPAQQQLWLFDQLDPGNPTYNIPAVLRVHGLLNLAALEWSLNAVVQRHASLRTTIAASQAEPVQVVAPFLSLLFPVIDLTTLATPQGQEDEAQRQIDAEALLPFDLARGPLIRAKLLRLSGTEHILLVTLHHIIADGWSIGILVQDLTALYSAFVGGNGAPSAAGLPELPIHYSDYTLWQQTFVESDVFAQHLAYWKQKLEHAPALLELPTDYLRPAVQPYRGRAEILTLPAPLARALQALSQREGATLFMTLLALFALLLSRSTGEEDILIGSPFANRDRPELEHLIGFFLNILVLRIDLTGGPTFLELLKCVRETCLGAYEHRDMPFDRLVAALNPERHLSYNPLFQVFFNLLNIDTLPTKPIDLPGLRVEVPTPFQVAAKFDLALYAQEREDAIQLDLIYNANLFAPARMHLLLEQFSSLAMQVVEHPEHPISRFSLLTSQMQALLPDPTAPLSAAWEGAVSTLFAQQAERVPAQLAAVDMYGQWSYEELNACSNRLANYLRAQGIGPQERVAIYAHRSASLVCAILGILKAGAVYLILDPLYPALRLADYCQQAQARGLIHLEEAGDVPPALEEVLLNAACRLELPRDAASVGQVLGAYSPADPVVEIGPDDLACIAFTSGSTGRPRGVLQRHGPLSHFLPEQQQLFGLTNADRYSMLAGLSSDPLQRDIFTPLCLGATICIPSPEDMMTPGWLAGWMQQQQISIAHLTPAMLRLLTQTSSTDSLIPSLRWALIVGDMLTKHDVAELSRLAPSVTCVNLYGSTESQRAVGYYILSTSRDAAQETSSSQEVAHLTKEGIPVGRGFTDVQLLILNRAQHMAGIGELGEIVIRSPHLAKGYLADDLLTQERFITNPFTGAAADRIYRTGDLGRYRPDGTIEYVGRTDYQVKLRGFRIALGEIEAMLRLHPAVQEVVVVVRAVARERGNMFSTGNPRAEGQASQRAETALVAYVVPGAEDRGKASLKHEFWQFLRARLPSYMVPAAFVLLEALPLLPNRKVDRAALPPPVLSNVEEAPDERRPLTPTEEVLAGLWTQVLGLERVGIYEDFFELGGHSLLATQLMARIAKAFQMTLPLRALFEAPTIAALATLLEQRSKSRSASGQATAVPLVAGARYAGLVRTQSASRQGG
jgi:amino acid adenylation domain-containing protein